MIPVDQDEVVKALDGSTLTEAEENKLEGRWEKSSDLVEGYIGEVYGPGDTVPGVVVRVVASAVARLYLRDRTKSAPLFAESKSQAMGPFNANLKFNTDATSGEPWLAKSDKLRLRNIYSGQRSQAMASDRDYAVPECVEGS